jgi:hypothetical protein
MRPIRLASMLLYAVFGAGAATYPAAVAKATGGPFKVTNDTVQDTATGLIWQRGSSPTTLTFSQATDYCAALELDGKKFRLPTIKELHTLVDESRIMPAIDPTAFPKTDPAVYWSATQLATFPGSVWAVSFSHGFDSWYDVSARQRTRCVSSPARS